MKQPHWTIYAHTHIESGRRYIGLTKKRMLQRWNEHVYNAQRKQGKGCRHFWNAIRKYGKDAFSHEVLEVCDTIETANAAEERWIEYLDTRNPEKGFNLKKGGAHTPHPVKNPWDRPEFRAKSTAIIKARWQDPVYRQQNLPNSMVHRAKATQVSSDNKTQSDPAVRANLSRIITEVANTPEGRAQRTKAANPGKTLSPEHREKIGEASRNRSPETRAKLSAASKAMWEDPEYKERMREANVGRVKSPETRAKISANNTGRVLSQETRDKIAASLKARPNRTHCKREHPMDDAVIGVDDKRRCRICYKMRQKAQSQKRRQQRRAEQE